MRRDTLILKYTECMQELYANAIGFDGKPGDFDALLKNFTIDKFGRKVISMDDYYISTEKFEEIIQKHLSDKKLRPYERKALSNELYLGATPTCNKEKWEIARENYCNR